MRRKSCSPVTSPFCPLRVLAFPVVLLCPTEPTEKTVASVAFAGLLPHDIAAQRRQHPVSSIKCPMCRQDMNEPLSGLHTYTVCLVHILRVRGARKRAVPTRALRDKLWASMVGHMRSDACVSLLHSYDPTPAIGMKVWALFAFVVIRSDKSPTVSSALWLGHVYRKAIFHRIKGADPQVADFRTS